MPKGRGSLPPQHGLELLTVYAWEQGGRDPQFSMAQGFRTVLELVTQYRQLCVYWTVNYSAEDKIVGEFLERQLQKPRSKCSPHRRAGVAGPKWLLSGSGVLGNQAPSAQCAGHLTRGFQLKCRTPHSVEFQQTMNNFNVHWDILRLFKICFHSLLEAQSPWAPYVCIYALWRPCQWTQHILKLVPGCGILPASETHAEILEMVSKAHDTSPTSRPHREVLKKTDAVICICLKEQPNPLVASAWLQEGKVTDQ